MGSSNHSIWLPVAKHNCRCLTGFSLPDCIWHQRRWRRGRAGLLLILSLTGARGDAAQPESGSGTPALRMSMPRRWERGCHSLRVLVTATAWRETTARVSACAEKGKRFGVRWEPNGPLVPGGNFHLPGLRHIAATAMGKICVLAVRFVPV